jgi:hypothetical protein
MPPDKHDTTFDILEKAECNGIISNLIYDALAPGCKKMIKEYRE